MKNTKFILSLTFMLFILGFMIYGISVTVNRKINEVNLRYTENKLIVVFKGHYENGSGKYYSKGKFIVTRDIDDSTKWVELEDLDLMRSGDKDSIYYNSEIGDTIVIKADLKDRFFTKKQRVK